MLVVNWSTSFSCLVGCIEMLSIQLTVCQMMRSPGHVVPVFPLRIIIFGSVSHVWPRSFRDGDICHMDCLTMLKLGGDSTWDLGWKYQMGVFLDRSILSLLLMVVRRINFRGFYAFPRISVDTNCWTTKIRSWLRFSRSNVSYMFWLAAAMDAFGPEPALVPLFEYLDHYFISHLSKKILTSERDRSLEKFTDR